MNCKELKENMFAFQEHTLSPERKQAFLIHLDECNECSLIFRQFQLALSTVDADKEAKPSPFAATHILQQIGSHIETRPRYFLMAQNPWIIRPVVAAVSLAVGIFLGINMALREPLPDSGLDPGSPVIQSLKSEFFITDFIEEDKSLTSFQ